MTGCRKVPHESKAKAHAHVKRMKERYGRYDGKAYFCQECKAFHVGRLNATKVGFGQGRPEVELEQMSDLELKQAARYFTDALKDFA